MALVMPKQHPLKDVLSDEIHSRSFPRIQGSVTLSQVVMLHDNDDKSRQLAHLSQLASRYLVAAPNPDSACYYQDLGELDVRWEYHTEFSSYTFIRLNRNERPFQCTAWSLLPESWRNELPGKLIAATHIDMQPNMPGRTTLQQLFNGQPLAVSRVYDNKAQLWTAFKTADDGFDRLLVVDQGLNQRQSGRLLRSVLELSSYRMMVLLSLPVSKALMPTIVGMEKELAQITTALCRINSSHEDEKALLSRLFNLSASLERLIADNRYRFDAAGAYFNLLNSRLDELGEQQLSGAVSLSEFLRRRITPFMDTVTSQKSRMLNLSERIDKTSALLRTTINQMLERAKSGLIESLEPPQPLATETASIGRKRVCGRHQLLSGSAVGLCLDNTRTLARQRQQSPNRRSIRAANLVCRLGHRS